MDFNFGLNLIIGDKDADFYSIRNNIAKEIGNHWQLNDYQSILKYIYKGDITHFIIDNIFSELHPGKHREAAKQLHNIAWLNHKVIIATCYSPVAVSVIPANHIYLAKGDKIISTADNSIGLTPNEILSFFMGVESYPDDINAAVTLFEDAIHKKCTKEADDYMHRLKMMINDPDHCPLISGLQMNYYFMS